VWICGTTKGKEAQPIVRRNDRHPDHLAEQAEHEEPLHRGAHFQGLLRELLAGHSVQEFAQRISPWMGGSRAIIRPAMTELIGIAAVAVVAWFAAGTIWNVRTGPH
jgi:hypothetical protein